MTKKRNPVNMAVGCLGFIVITLVLIAVVNWFIYFVRP